MRRELRPYGLEGRRSRLGEGVRELRRDDEGRQQRGGARVGDGSCDAVDACVGPAAVAKPKVVVDRLSGGSAPQRLTFKGELQLPVPVSPPFDPLTNGIRFELANTTVAVLDVTIPGGAVAGMPAVGWSLKTSASRKRWLYVDKRTGVPDGTYGVTIIEPAATPGLLKFTVKGKRPAPIFGRLALDLPVSGLLSVDLPLASSGQCGTAAFPGLPGPSCTLTTKLTCR